MSRGNKNKAKGTNFETSIKNYFNENSSYQADRAPLSGNGDQGDVWAVHKEDSRVIIIECKNYKRPSRGLVETWRKQTVTEKDNYLRNHPDVKYAECLLITKSPGQGIKDSIVHFISPEDGWYMQYLNEYLVG